MFNNNRHRLIFRILGLIAILFGFLTLKSGGMVLFVDGPDRAAAGNYVPFVLWFNFVAGFFYIAAGAGLWKQKKWAVRLSTLIALATLAVFLAFALYINTGAPYEARTVGAMTLRSSIWVFIALLSHFLARKNGRPQTDSNTYFDERRNQP